jgi:hypothetical protein
MYKMERIQFIQYKNKSILLEDFSNLVPGGEFKQLIAHAQQTITSQPPQSVLALLDATNAHFDAEIMALMKEFVSANTPYIKCAAVVGIEGLLKIALMAITNAAGRSFTPFEDRQSAMEFLTSQS